MKLVNRLLSLVEDYDSLKKSIMGILEKNGFKLVHLPDGQGEYRLYYSRGSDEVETGITFMLFHNGEIRVEFPPVYRSKRMPSEVMRYADKKFWTIYPSLRFSSFSDFMKVFLSFRKVLLSEVKRVMPINQAFKRIVSEASRIAKDKGFELEDDISIPRGTLELKFSYTPFQRLIVETEVEEYEGKVESYFRVANNTGGKYVNTGVFDSLPKLLPDSVKSVDEKDTPSRFTYVVRWKSLDKLASGMPKALDLLLKE